MNCSSLFSALSVLLMRVCLLSVWLFPILGTSHSRGLLLSWSGTSRGLALITHGIVGVGVLLIPELYLAQAHIDTGICVKAEVTDTAVYMCFVTVGCIMWLPPMSSWLMMSGRQDTFTFVLKVLGIWICRSRVGVSRCFSVNIQIAKKKVYGFVASHSSSAAYLSGYCKSTQRST